MITITLQNKSNSSHFGTWSFRHLVKSAPRLVISALCSICHCYLWYCKLNKIDKCNLLTLNIVSFYYYYYYIHCEAEYEHFTDNMFHSNTYTFKVILHQFWVKKFFPWKLCLPQHPWLFIFLSRSHDRQSSEQNNRKLISLHNNGEDYRHGTRICNGMYYFYMHPTFFSSTKQCAWAIISRKEFKSWVTCISFALLYGKTELSAIKYFAICSCHFGTWSFQIQHLVKSAPRLVISAPS
jgi:hypothetical protein